MKKEFEISKTRTVNNSYGFHCPLCGTKLVIYDPIEGPEIDWGNDSDKEIDRKLELQKNHDECRRLDCVCPNGHFQEDFPLYLHSPLYGCDSAPGDNWSLTWLK